MSEIEICLESNLKNNIEVDISSSSITHNVEEPIVIFEGGVKKYSELAGKPQIGNKILESGENNIDDLGIQKKGDYPEDEISNLEIYTIMQR